MKRPIPRVARSAAALVSALVLAVQAGACVPRLLRDARPSPPYAASDSLRVPTKFAEGVVSTEDGDWCTTFSPDGREVIFMRPPENIVSCRFVNGAWSRATTLPFSGTYRDEWPSLSPDGRRLYFCSTRPAQRDEKADWDIWVVDRASGGWTEPRKLGAPINTAGSETSPSTSSDGTLYFARGGDIYRSRLRQGQYLPPEKLDGAVNTPFAELDPRISADGRRLAFCRIPADRQQSEGDGQAAEPKPVILVSSMERGEWSTPLQFPYRDTWRPYISPDSRYLFFSSTGDIFQVDLPGI